MGSSRLLIKVTRETLSMVRERYPFLYLERGRLEVDDSSVKWIDCSGGVIPLPIATIQMLLLGPGTSVTHEAIKCLASCNCMIAWVGEEAMLFYAYGIAPTADSRNLLRQVEMVADSGKRLEVAKRMFKSRFPKDQLHEVTLAGLMGMEGRRVKALYLELANYYQVGWTGRAYKPGEFSLSDVTNKILTACNAAFD